MLVTDVAESMKSFSNLSCLERERSRNPFHICSDDIKRAYIHFIRQELYECFMKTIVNVGYIDFYRRTLQQYKFGSRLLFWNEFTFIGQVSRKLDISLESWTLSSVHLNLKLNTFFLLFTVLFCISYLMTIISFILFRLLSDRFLFHLCIYLNYAQGGKKSVRHCPNKIDETIVIE